MSEIRCGWLLPSGEFAECEPYEHLAVARELVKDRAPYATADEYLLDHGAVKIYRESFCGHQWHVNRRGFLSEPQKRFLRPIFEDPDNDIYAYCRKEWEDEAGRQ